MLHSSAQEDAPAWPPQPAGRWTRAGAWL